MNPLPPLALLTTHVDHQHFVVSQIETGFRDADCAGPAVDDVLLVGNIAGIKEPAQIGEIIIEAVGERM